MNNIYSRHEWQGPGTGARILDHAGYSFINIAGLAVALACSFFILLWVQDELSVDRFLKEGDRIYRVWRNVDVGGQIYTFGGTSKPLADVLTEYPAISEAVYSFGQEFVVTAGNQSFRERGNFASAAFFEVFAFSFIQGNPETALEEESSAAITDRAARKLFGDDWRTTESVLGRRLTIDHRKDFTVSGVIEDIPPNSSYQSDIILPIQDFFSRNAYLTLDGLFAPQ